MRGFLSKHELLWPCFGGVPGVADGEEMGETWHLDASTWSLWSRFGDVFPLSRMAMKSDFLRAQIALVIKTDLTCE